MSDDYAQPRYEGPQAIVDAIAANDVDKLREMVIAAALYEEDFEVAQRFCIQLSEHSDEIVRGNAVLGFGHLARLFESLSEQAIEIVRDRLQDPSSYVQGQAYAAAGDLNHFLGVDVLPT